MPVWGDGYFERQVDAKCGQHALNNVVGAPQFREEFFEEAVRLILLERNYEREDQHRNEHGWYSHSVLAQALELTNPVIWRLLYAELLPSEYRRLLETPDWIGAIVNEGNRHWVAIVKRADRLWRLDSGNPPPVLLDEASFHTYLQQAHRTGFVVALN